MYIIEVPPPPPPPPYADAVAPGTYHMTMSIPFISSYISHSYIVHVVNATVSISSECLHWRFDKRMYLNRRKAWLSYITDKAIT